MQNNYENKMINQNQYNNKSILKPENAGKSDITIQRSDLFDLAYLLNYAVSELNNKRLNEIEKECVKTGIKLIHAVEKELSI